MTDESNSQSIAIFDRFTAAWDSGKPIELPEFLKANPQTPSTTLLALIQEDQRRRWQLDEQRPIEFYLDHFGKEFDSEENKVDLIYSEALLREDLGLAIDEQQFVDRFPDFEESLRRQLRFHSALLKAEVTLQEKGSTDATQHLRQQTADQALTPANSPEIPGYEILGQAGQGASAIVYRARDKVLHRIVAIKLLPSHSNQSFSRDQVLSEARAAAQIPHPHIAQLYEIGECSAGCYLVMEYLDGGSLAQRLADSALEPSDAAKILSVIARAVQAAHEQDIVHRDLKPQNILFDLMGTPKVSDFGLARNISPDESMGATENIVGTPQYMAPEQARTGPGSISKRADIYSLGAILYATLTGRPPHQAGTVWATIEQVLTSEPVSIRRLNPDVPNDLETIGHRAIHQEPERRYTSALEFAEELERWSAGKPILSRPISRIERSRRWCQRNPKVALLTAGVATLLLTGAIGSSLFAFQIAKVNRELVKQQQRSIKAQVDTVIRAQPAALELAIRDCTQREEVLEQLQIKFKASEVEAEKLNAAFAIGSLDQPNWDFLIQALQECPSTPDRCQNFVATFEAHRSQAKQTLLAELTKLQQPDSAVASKGPGIESDQPLASNTRVVGHALAERQLRVLIVLLHLREFQTAEQWLNQPTPIGESLDSESRISRTAKFAQVFENWHGKLDWFPELGVEPELQSTRIAVGQALGELPTSGRRPSEQESLIKAVRKWRMQANDAGTHSVATWILSKWQESPIDLRATTTGNSSNPGWFVEREGLTFARIPTGRFRMLYSNVAPATLPNRNPNNPIPSMVTIAKPFYMATTEVPCELYQEFMKEAKSQTQKQEPDVDAGYEIPFELQPQLAADEFIGVSDRAPIQGVRWVDAILFCNWLSERNGLRPCYQLMEKEKAESDQADGAAAELATNWNCDFTANGFRLPTEAEWEYACRAGSDTRYAFGNDQTLVPHFARTSNFRRVPTYPVGSLRPNRWGLFDMHGNVWEWCWDYFDDLPAEARLDPSGPTVPSPNYGNVRVYRGGGIGNYSADPDATARGYTSPLNVAWNLGFRVVTNRAPTSR